MFVTIGAAARVLIKNVATAAPRLLEDFAGTAIAAATRLADRRRRRGHGHRPDRGRRGAGIVKTVVENVESAARLAVAFFKRVGVSSQAW
ncbi:hypothetical protein [Nannocystis sp.]|uniref:hypothetical protein n=1 Tax=Nannocystis sp. TaxID=1962667 RepID=UPI0025D09C3D|nr:hypothetical protein [Nannocystis sp.]MBK7829352.1 hypothetical protein [Nannocystis sp.]